MTAVIKVRILPSAVGVHFALEGTGKKAVAPHKYVCLAGSEHPLNKQTRNRQEEVLMSPPFQPSPPILYNHVDYRPDEDIRSAPSTWNGVSTTANASGDNTAPLYTSSEIKPSSLACEGRVTVASAAAVAVPGPCRSVMSLLSRNRVILSSPNSTDLPRELRTYTPDGEPLPRLGSRAMTNGTDLPSPAR
eukprot:CAMPEP_0197466502 /NCGR_PEP_ID=MMETSP1175-20131217/65086_1 /TAXON_ID=1003142 /ORGANISM="Triceratium dubium, Strain CCMP147" /LENGTH=189 /DNA_ID=CAMNT_0043002547 /DNA_START=763 /DNA_END=1329 /DNA_ORIENTATION=-